MTDPSIEAKSAEIEAGMCTPVRSGGGRENRDQRLIDWVYLYATEGGGWPDQKSVVEPLIELAARRGPTQEDADLLAFGGTLKALLALPSDPSAASTVTPQDGQADAAMTPTAFVDDILSACDASNWDADRNTGDYYRGLKDAYEHIMDIAVEYQTAMYGATKRLALALPRAELASAIRRRIVMEEGCPTCAELAQGSMGPPHDPSPNCESGKRPHCTCDICF